MITKEEYKYALKVIKQYLKYTEYSISDYEKKCKEPKTFDEIKRCSRIVKEYNEAQIKRPIPEVTKLDKDIDLLYGLMKTNDMAKYLEDNKLDPNDLYYVIDILKKNQITNEELKMLTSSKLDLINLFKSLGFTLDEFNKIRYSYALIHVKDHTLYNNFSEIINYLYAYGFEKQYIRKIIKKTPGICQYRLTNIEEKLEELKNIGLTDLEIKKVLVSSPTIFDVSVDSIYSKIEVLTSFGLTYDEVLTCIKYNPSILTNSINSIKEKYNNLLEHGFTTEEANHIILVHPRLLNANLKSTSDKIEFLDSINLKSIILINPIHLAMGLDVLKARYNYLTSKQRKITLKNYKILVSSSSTFEKTYGIKNNTLLSLYKDKTLK